MLEVVWPTQVVCGANEAAPLMHRPDSHSQPQHLISDSGSISLLEMDEKRFVYKNSVVMSVNKEAS